MTEHVNKRTKITRLFDPLIVLGIFLVFLVPVITVLNLTPKYQKPATNNNVLGVQDQTTVTITPNRQVKDGLFIRNIFQNTESSYSLILQQDRHNAGTYSNELFTVNNPTTEERKINVSSTFNGIADGTKVSLLLRSVKYVIRTSEGEVYPPSLYVMPGEKLDVAIVIENSSRVNFQTEFGIDLDVE